MKKNLSLLVLFVAIVLVLLLIASNNRGDARPAAKKTDAVASKHSDPAPATKPAPPSVQHALPVSFRPLNFALLRGGFTTPDEFFARVQADPILSSFYGACSEKSVAIKPLADDILVFSTFRRGNQIKWARKPLLVHKGEYVLTFCGKTVLARCANLISWTPMQPSEDVPPSLLEIPTEVISDPATAVTTTTETQPAPGVLAAAATPMPAASSHRFFFVPPIYIPSSSGHSVAPPTAAVVGLESDEFTGHQALFTLLMGFFVIGLVKFLTR